jgi:hypothetical protein
MKGGKKPCVPDGRPGHQSTPSHARRQRSPPLPRSSLYTSFLLGPRTRAEAKIDLPLKRTLKCSCPLMLRVVLVSPRRPQISGSHRRTDGDRWTYHGEKLGQKHTPRWRTKAEKGKREGRTSLEGAAGRWSLGLT